MCACVRACVTEAVSVCSFKVQYKITGPKRGGGEGGLGGRGAWGEGGGGEGEG